MDFNAFERKLRSNNPHLRLLSEARSEKETVRVFCSDCGCDFLTKAYNLRKSMERGNGGCPVCAGRLVVRGANDVGTTASWLLPYFADKNDAYTHTRTSKAKAMTVCPVCGAKREYEIGKMYARGFRCSVCSDTVSYPNKFARALLSQLPVLNWVCEYHAEWLGARSFDNYFEYMGGKYVLEMDGEQHFSYVGRGRSVDEEQENDRLKDRLAESHGISVIRIDCTQSDRYFIQRNIEASALAGLFDLSRVDWELCASTACRSLVLDVCGYYNEVSTDTKEIAGKFRLNPSTVVVYLKQGASFGLCDFSYSIVRKRVGEKNKRTLRDRLGIPVRAFDGGMNLIGEYKSYGDCADELNKVYEGIGFLANSLRTKFAAAGGKVWYKGFYFERAR